MFDLATPLLAPLAAGGTTAATLSALHTRIETYKLASPGPTTGKAHVSSLTTLLEDELRRGDMIQRDRLDGLMEQFSDTNETLFNDYKNARKKNNNKGGSKKTATKSASSPTPPANP
jgi:hypothetical protein